MTNTEATAIVVRLACLTEDRTNKEQRALLTVARRIDSERNSLASGNVGDGKMWLRVKGGYQRMQPESRLEDEVMATRVLGEDGDDRPVRLPAKSKHGTAYDGLTFVPDDIA